MRLPAGGLRPGLENAWGRRASYAGIKKAAREPRHGPERHYGRAGKDDGWETPFPAARCEPAANPKRCSRLPRAVPRARDRLTRSHGAGAARGRDGGGDNVACKHTLAEVQRVMALKDFSLAPTGCKVFVINS